MKTTTTLLLIAGAGVAAFLIFKVTQKPAVTSVTPSVPTTTKDNNWLSDVSNYTNAISTIGNKANDLFNLFNSSLQGGGGQS